MANSTYNPKNIIVCCDGTANRFTQEGNNTNVVRFFCLLDQSEPERQIAYYDPGVGILTLGPFATVYDYFDRATGYGIDKNIKDAYQYLMNSYEEGDRIFLIGFSRGAYTVRTLSGLLNRCGLLHKRNLNLIDDAYYYYIRQGDTPQEIELSEETAKKFKSNFSRDVEIYCIGVWDTVKAVLAGSVRGELFHDRRLSSNVKFGYQALAIDEHRTMFDPELWDWRVNLGQEITQVWFAGVHADIGGSYPEDGLANISLNWMIAQISQHGIYFKSEVPDKLPIPDPCAVMHDEYKVGVWSMLGSKRRVIPEGALIHDSVAQRINRCGGGYNPPLPKHHTFVPTLPITGNQLNKVIQG